MLYDVMKSKSGENLVIPRGKNNISNESENLLKGLLIFNPKERLSWWEFFEHPVFNTDFKPEKRETRMKKILSQMIFFSMCPVVKEKEVEREFENNKKSSKVPVEEEYEISPMRIGSQSSGPGFIFPSQTLEKAKREKFEERNRTNTIEETDRLAKNFSCWLDHGTKKIEFLFQTITALRNLEGENEDWKKTASFACFILAKKGNQLLHFLTSTIKSKSEILDMPGYNEFLNSTFLRTEALKKFEEMEEIYENSQAHWSDIAHFASKGEEDKKAIAHLEKENETPEELSNRLQRAFERLLNLVQKDKKLEKENELRLKCLRALLQLGWAVDENKHFPYECVNGYFECRELEKPGKDLNEKEIMKKLNELEMGFEN